MPRRPDRKTGSSRTSTRAPSQTVALAATRNGQIRRRTAPAWPPIRACHTLVTREGTIRSAIAGCRPRVAARRPRLIVGKPKPITPFTVPASRNIPTMIESMAGSEIIKSDMHALYRHARPVQISRRTAVNLLRIDSAPCTIPLAVAGCHGPLAHGNIQSACVPPSKRRNCPVSDRLRTPTRAPAWRPE